MNLIFFRKPKRILLTLIKHEFQEFRNKVAENKFLIYKINTFPKSRYTINTRRHDIREQNPNEVQKNEESWSIRNFFFETSSRKRNLESEFYASLRTVNPSFPETQRSVKIFPSHLWEKLQKPCCGNRYYGLTFHGNTYLQSTETGCLSHLRNFSLIVFYLCVNLG